MSKVRINDLARELEVKPRAILDMLPELGVAGGKTHSSSLEADEAEKVRARFAQDAKPAAHASAAAVRHAGQTIVPKIDLSHISKPGDVMKAILAKKKEEEKEARQARLPVKPAAAPATKPVAPAAPPTAAIPAAATPAAAFPAAATPAAAHPAPRKIVPQPRSAPPIIAPPARLHPPSLRIRPQAPWSPRLPLARVSRRAPGRRSCAARGSSGQAARSGGQACGPGSARRKARRQAVCHIGSRGQRAANAVHCRRRTSCAGCSRNPASARGNAGLCSCHRRGVHNPRRTSRAGPRARRAHCAPHGDAANRPPASLHSVHRSYNHLPAAGAGPHSTW